MASEIVEEPTEIMEGPSETFTEERPRIARPVINWTDALERAEIRRMRKRTLLYLMLYLLCLAILLLTLALIAAWDITGKFKPKKSSFELMELNGGQSLAVNVPVNSLRGSMAIKMESQIHNSKLRVWYEGMSVYMTFSKDNKMIVQTPTFPLPAMSQTNKEKLEWFLGIGGEFFGLVPEAASQLLPAVQSGGNVTGSVHVRGLEKWKSYRLQKTSGNHTIEVDCPVTISVVSDGSSVYGPCTVSYI